MKIKVIAILILLIFTSLNAQSKDEKIESLINTDLIKPNQKNQIKKIVSEIEIESNAKYILALYELKFKEFTGYDHGSSDVNIDFDSYKNTEEEQLLVRKKLFNYLEKLKSIGLISNEQFHFQKERVGRDDYVDILELLPDLVAQVFYDEALAPNKLNSYRKKLIEYNIITEEKNKSLKNYIDSNKVKTPYQFIDFCEKARFFDLAKYSDNPKIYLEEIHKLTAEILPELKFSNFKYEIKSHPESSVDPLLPSHVLISFDCNNKTYESKSFISLEDITKERRYFGKLDSTEYYQIFNQVLKDLKSSYRLHHVYSSYNYTDKFDPQYFGIIALRESQIGMFRDFNSYWNYLRVSYEDFKN